MRRICLLLSLCLLAAAPAEASARQKDAAPTRAYVETSYVIAPRRVGDFTLVSSSFDPGNHLAGASLLYQVKDHPEVTINLYVYAAGRLDPDTAVTEGMQAFDEGMKQAVSSGTYSSQRALGPASAFLLTGADAPRPASASDLDAAVLGAVTRTNQIPGQKVRLQLHRATRDAPLRSNAYLFYKQLHYVKVRISAWEPDIAAGVFDALADQAARALVPAVRVANVGGCASATLYVDPHAPQDQMAAMLTGQLSRQQGYNCHASADAAGIDERRTTADVIEIAYAPDDWTSQ
ncbi:hypothetical protein KQ945_08680 [Bacillus subtilis subsp. subtilis]|nr:hypothetical protein [Bacillus subtilis subsp. subtilis]